MLCACVDPNRFAVVLWKSPICALDDVVRVSCRESRSRPSSTRAVFTDFEVLPKTMMVWVDEEVGHIGSTGRSSALANVMS